jgi:phosphoglucosamine mutase
MRQSGASLGGEKSGHVILLQHASTGDGVVTALATMQVMARRGRPLSELAAEIPLFPQQQRAVLVRHKDRWLADASLTAAIAEVEAELRGQGRVLVRPSGTEPALRIMIEGEDEARVSTLADQLAALAGERLN